ncbi:hypothetical protein AB0J83_46925 [Actinoplanes sp. NPDC049596]|uniref:hypothetical protein n=1 Tax=unclassified Actinoplanes TaxID=2626549 RepID=UPI0034339B12
MGLDLRSATTGQQSQQIRPGQKISRKPRHAGLFEAVHRLDAGLDQGARAQLSEWIRAEYESEFGDVPLGMFALCHLGPPYIDHRLDLWQSIVEHYAPADLVPEPFNQARMLVRTGAYDFVEIYASGELRPVLKDGSVVA